MNSPEHCNFHELSTLPSVRNMRSDARWRVWLFVVEAGERGAIDEEIASALALKPTSARPRRAELVKMGCLKDSGKRRPTTSARPAVVWVARQTPLEALR